MFNFEGKIIVAEDQFINLEIMKQYFEQIGILNSDYSFCIDGQEAIDKSISIINQSINDLEKTIVKNGLQTNIRPIVLMLLDF